MSLGFFVGKIIKNISRPQGTINVFQATFFLKFLHPIRKNSGHILLETLAYNKEKFGPHKVDPTRFAGFSLLQPKPKNFCLSLHFKINFPPPSNFSNKKATLPVAFKNFILFLHT